ncbi:hypothetical protein Tco_1466631 [Tanacetum coccineum]
MAWLNSMKRLSMKKRFGKKEFVSKQERKKSKPKSTLNECTVFDDQDTDHGMEYMDTEEAMDEGRQSGETKEVKLTDDTEVVEDKGNGKGLGWESPVKKVKRSDLDAAQIAKDAEIARLIHEPSCQCEREREERQRQDQAFVDYIESLYDEVQAKMDAIEELAARLQMEEKERDVHNRRKRALEDESFIRSQKEMIDFDLEEEEQLRASLKIVPDEEEEIDYEVLCTRVHILALEDGTEIHMLAERWYLIIRETLERMMELRLTAESEGEAVLDLLRFIQK